MKRILLLLYFIPMLAFGQITNEYLSLKPASYSNIMTFNYTGAYATWTAPTGCTSILAVLIGAQGGCNGCSTNAYVNGGRVKCKIAVTPGQTYYIVVGGQSNTSTAAYGFGGNGGTLLNFSNNWGAAGGGLSGIFTSSTPSQANAIAIAGGGGALGNYSGSAGYGSGGGLIGNDGYSSFGWGYGQIWGLGGTQSAGGAHGITYDVGTTIAPTSGSALYGGNGGTGNGGSSGWRAGGGGGGGYYGGGGGVSGGNATGGGGGGSSWTNPTYCTDVQNIGNYKGTGHGKVILYY